MKDDRETKEKLLASAEHEFMEKGYQGASLRNICKNAGVTTGALYFFFKDKDDIFASLVAPVLGSIRTMMEAHMQQELQEVKGELQEGKDDFSDDIYASRRIIHELYQNYDRVQLLLTKVSQDLQVLQDVLMNLWHLQRRITGCWQTHRQRCVELLHRMIIRYTGWHICRSMHLSTSGFDHGRRKRIWENIKIFRMGMFFMDCRG